MMVNRLARREMAQLIRQFVSGRMTNEDYVDQLVTIPRDKSDPALQAAYWAVWGLYDDLREHKLSGRNRVYGETRRNVARLVLFLQSDREYRWHKDVWDGSGFIIAAFFLILQYAVFQETPLAMKLCVTAVVGLSYFRFEQWQSRKRKRFGDQEAWPFLHQADLDEAVKHPRLLNGKR